MNANNPAFPLSVSVNSVGDIVSSQGTGDESMTGLTKREYFAAMVLAGLSAEGGAGIKNTVVISVEAADLLIKELEKKQDVDTDL